MREKRGIRGEGRVGCIVWLALVGLVGYVLFQVVPVTKDNLTITKTREKITIETHYDVNIVFFGGVYTYNWKRDLVVERPLFVV